MGCCASKKKKKVVEEMESESSEEKPAKYARAPRYSKHARSGNRGDSDDLSINYKGDGKEEPQKVYSWDKPREFDTSQYIVKDLKEELAIRGGGSIDGQQFIIQDCESSTVVLLDFSDTITVDNCTDCRFVIGPVGGSIFFRNCQGCSCSVACQQFRTRDCDEMNIFLHCTTQPVIESSRNMRFHPMRMNYTDLVEDYKKANLSVFDNHWDNIHDFTPDDYCRNYSTTTSIDPVEIFKFHENEMLAKGSADPSTITNAHLSFTDDDCLIPLVNGEGGRGEETAVVILFHHQLMTEEVILDIFHRISQVLTLVMTRHFDFGSDEACRVFIDDSPQSIACRNAATTGRMVGAEYSGDDAVKIVNSVMGEYMSGMPPESMNETLCYTSPNDEDTNHVLNVLNTLHNSRFDC